MDHIKRRWTPIAVAAVSAIVMAGLTWLSEKKRMQRLDNSSIAVSMLIGMLAAIVIGHTISPLTKPVKTSKIISNQ